MAGDLTLAMRLLLDARSFVQGLTTSGQSVSKFTTRTRSEIDRIRDGISGVRGRIAQLGISVGGMALALQSARVDKELIQIGLTAGASSGQVSDLRDELFRLSSESGKSVEDLMAGFNSLVQSGLSFDQALATMNGVNRAMAVSGSNAQTLARGITVAARAFHFDLTNPRTANEILEKMTVAGRLGNAELEDLAGVFGRVGNAAAKAGMDFDESLSIIEGLSMSLPGQPERLATRAESTLRLFTNLQYLKSAQSATGVKFFDATGARRQTAEVFADLKQKFDKLQTDAERAKFIQRAFGKTDLDTQQGIFEILSGNNLKQMQSFRSEIAGASGTFSKDMERALDNSVDQVDRLKSALREAADGFLHPINEGINKSIKKLLDPKEKGGLGLSGGELIAGGGALLGFGYLAKRFGGPLLGKLLGGLGDLGVGVATGKALEQTVGVTPVYVVNMPSNGFGGGVLPGLGPIGLPGATLALPGAAVTASRVAMLARGGLGVLGAGAAGYAAGSMIYDAIDETDVADKIGAAVAHALAFFGNDAAKESLAQREKYEASLKVQIEDKRTRITHMSSSSDKLAVDATTGPMFEGHW